MSVSDTDIDNYSVQDLLTILNLTVKSNSYQITDAANSIIARMKTEGNPALATFFMQARDKLLKAGAGSSTPAGAGEDAGEGEDADEDDQQVSDNQPRLSNVTSWWQHQYPPQKNKIQSSKYTDRNHKVQFQTTDQTHFQMNREQLGVNQNFSLPVAQGTLNPNLQNTTKRLVVIDSQYRQNILPYISGDPTAPAYNTDYTLDLSDPLHNVISLKLYSVSIPTTWYALDNSIGNTCFTYNGVPYTIPSGNYRASDLSGVFYDISGGGTLALTVSGPDLHTGLLSFTNTDASASTLVFNTNGICGPSACGPGAKVNQHLGWNLGFRREPDLSGNIVIDFSGNAVVKSDVQPSMYGPAYFILVVDDYNNNHLNNGLVNISDTAIKLSLPAYYNTANTICLNPVANLVGITKSSPRTLTQAQLYTVNEIIANRKIATNRTTGPTTTDVLALIPLRGITALRPEPYIEFGGNLQTNERTYFGPVDIDRFRVRLLDDKGNVVNLHDNDWSFSLTVEQLYQY